LLPLGDIANSALDDFFAGHEITSRHPLCVNELAIARDAASAGISAGVPKAERRADRSKTPQRVQVVRPRGNFAGSANYVGNSLLRLLDLAATVL